MTKILILLYRIKAFNRKLKSIKWSLSGLTVDVGGGSRPNPLADIIVESYIDDNSHRQGRTFESLGKYCVVADAENLPFKQKAIDHLSCSHVLEHVINPRKVLSEFSRVAKKGYIEVPSYESELFFDREDHIWVVKKSLSTDDHLEFVEKKGLYKNGLNNLISHYPNSFYLLYFDAFNYFNLSIYWTDFIDCSQNAEIKEIKLDTSSKHFEDPKVISILNRFTTFLFVSIKSLYSKRININDVINIMICSHCHSENIFLENNNSWILCKKCYSTMKIHKNIIYAKKYT